jgi:hypothetical protein
MGLAEGTEGLEMNKDIGGKRPRMGNGRPLFDTATR